MNGVHPFSCVVTTKESMSNFQPVKNIQNGYCPYFTKSNINGKIAKTRYSPNIGILPRDIFKSYLKEHLLKVNKARAPDREQTNGFTHLIL